MATSSQHPLEQKIDRLIRRVRRANAIRAAALAGVVATVSLGVAGAVDMLVRSSERGSQTVLAALFVALSAAGLRWLWKPILRTRYDRVQIARRIEQAFPELRGVLASALEFASASADDPLAGSARLRALVVERATRRATVPRGRRTTSRSHRPPRARPMVSGSRCSPGRGHRHR